MVSIIQILQLKTAILTLIAHYCEQVQIKDNSETTVKYSVVIGNVRTNVGVESMKLFFERGVGGVSVSISCES